MHCQDEGMWSVLVAVNLGPPKEECFVMIVLES